MMKMNQQKQNNNATQDMLNGFAYYEAGRVSTRAKAFLLASRDGVNTPSHKKQKATR